MASIASGCPNKLYIFDLVDAHRTKHDSKQHVNTWAKCTGQTCSNRGKNRCTHFDTNGPDAPTPCGMN